MKYHRLVTNWALDVRRLNGLICGRLMGGADDTYYNKYYYCHKIALRIGICIASPIIFLMLRWRLSPKKSSLFCRIWGQI